MALILSIETATKVCSVALHKKGQLLELKESFVPNSHSELLTTFISEVMDTAGKALADLEAICLSKGPGSYTGLRIGSSTAKGLCFTLDIPFITINTLQGMALQQLTSNNQLLCPMLDARRMEVYCALFDGEGNFVSDTEAKVIDENSFSETLADHKVLFFGSGGEKCKIIVHPNAAFVDGVYPSAESLGQLAYNKYVKEEFEDVAYFEPYYLKEFYTVPPKKAKL